MNNNKNENEDYVLLLEDIATEAVEKLKIENKKAADLQEQVSLMEKKEAEHLLLLKKYNELLTQFDAIVKEGAGYQTENNKLLMEISRMRINLDTSLSTEAHLERNNIGLGEQLKKLETENSTLKKTASKCLICEERDQKESARIRSEMYEWQKYMENDQNFMH